MNIQGGNTLIDANLILEVAQIGDKSKVADLGCGATGHFVFPAASLVGRRGVVYAVDILKTILENIGRRVKLENIQNIRTVWSDIEMFGATKIENNSLDVAMLINTLYQSHKRAEILRESARMVKKDGILIVVEWKNIATPIGPPAEEKVKKDLLIIGAKKLGLMLEEEFEAGQYHFGLILKKI